MINRLFSKKSAPENLLEVTILPPNALQLAMAHHQSGELAQAQALYQQILQVEPDHPDALHFLGVLAHQVGDHQTAVNLITQAIAVNPSVNAMYCNLALAYQALGQWDELIHCYQTALTLQPEQIEIQHQLANLLAMQHQNDEAIVHYRAVLNAKPNDPQVLNNLGGLLKEQLQLDEAVEVFQRLLIVTPTAATAYYNLALVLHQQHNLDAAISHYQQAIVLKADYAESYYHLALAYQGQNKLDAAIAHFQQAIAIAENYFAAHYQLGTIYQNLQDAEAAIASYQQALKCNPHHPETHCYLGNLYHAQRKFEQAINCYQNALTINPHYLDAQHNLGATFSAIGNLTAALNSFLQLLSLNPACAKTHCEVAGMLQRLYRQEEAIAHYQQALQLQPDNNEALGQMFYAQLQSCDWENYAQNRNKIIALITEQQLDYEPIAFMAISDSAAAQLRCAQTYGRKYPPLATALSRSQRYQHNKIRIAYLSADFREHPVSFLMVGLFELHDKSRFETIALSFNPEDNSPTGQRVKQAFAQFIDVSQLSDAEVAQLMQTLEIDIAVDLLGYTGQCRTTIFSLRAAPIQVNYLGYPATMGVDYMDYILADTFVIPATAAEFYREKIVYLPDSYLVCDAKRQICDYLPSRGEVNLSEKSFVFCCFNDSYKITPEVFAVWLNLLKTKENSVLWLRETNALAVKNLRKAAVLQGISPERLIFAPRLKNIDEHLSRLKLADLFLDTPLYNAHTTASDALWAGLPVLTCIGNAFASRVAGSLLTALGLPELITENLAAYEALAIKLATTPPLLAEIRQKLAENRTTYPLFDTDRSRRHFEAAYTTMWEKHQRGELPNSFAVPALV